MKKLFSIILSFSFAAVHAQYAPQAGVSGSTAIHAASPSFSGWASGCSVQRGYMNIADPGLGPASAGTDMNGSGMADQNIVSLGDSGIATLTFDGSIYNGQGADFAVFENGFVDPNNTEMAFLELAFVEVSSDGVNFFRFPAHSLTPIGSQVPMAGVYMDAKQLNNLAGKYTSNYGTPFDLEELNGISGLDINQVTHVRIVDVVGAISSLYGSQDSAGNLVNDPYPTDIPTGGFDLDAVGVIHLNSTIVKSEERIQYSIYPNPVSDQLYVKGGNVNLKLTLRDVSGRLLSGKVFEGVYTIDMRSFGPGVYFLAIEDENGKRCVEKIVKE